MGITRKRKAFRRRPSFSLIGRASEAEKLTVSDGIFLELACVAGIAFYSINDSVFHRVYDTDMVG